MPNSELAAVLDSGAVVVTPNNRLARFVADRHDRAQSAAGRAVWPTPRALPWDTWLSTLWLDALAVDAWPVPFALLNATQSARLWERAIDADATLLLDSAGAGLGAASAWKTFHAYANSGESTGQFSGGGDDAAAFARWTRRFARSCADTGAVDAAELADRLIEVLQRVPFVRDRGFALAGFVEFTPQQARLVDAVRAAGAKVTIYEIDSRNIDRSRTQYLTSTDELVAALQWARERTSVDPAAEATIAVVDLPARHDLIVQLADEILRPATIASAQLDRPRPFNISLALPLSAHPLVVPALDILELAQRKLPLARASSLLRSPYLAGGATAAARRSCHERHWRERNVTDVSLNSLILALADDDALRTGLMAVSQRLRAIPPRSPHEWADCFGDVLGRCGWPGGDAQSSAVFQAHDALLRVIGEWRTLALVEPRMDFGLALSSLRAECARTTFQPESARSRVQILGMLEAAGLEFDGLWLAGMDSDAWPPRVTPETYLPVIWQRARGVVQASAELSLERAKRLTAQLASSAREAIASHVITTDTPARSVSPLCNWTLQSRPPQPTPTMRAIASAPRLDGITDVKLPALALHFEIKGGVRVVELQSDCPFRAAAALRLRVDAWPRPGIGLTAMERGILVHAAMASLWSSIKDRATLLQLDDASLQACIADAVESARNEIAEMRWRNMPAVIAAIEASRLAVLMFTFVREHEATRPPFRVVANEKPVELAIGGLKLNLRVDRVDAIDGGLAVIDYKTGTLPPASQWLLPRPVAPQTGLYVLALKQSDPAQAVCAVALASIKSGASAMRGIRAHMTQWEALVTPEDASNGRLRDFAELEAWWRDTFDALADAFRRGEAAVTPRVHPNPCLQCDFKPFCRIDLHTVGSDDEGEDRE